MKEEGFGGGRGRLCSFDGWAEACSGTLSPEVFVLGRTQLRFHMRPCSRHGRAGTPVTYCRTMRHTDIYKVLRYISM